MTRSFKLDDHIKLHPRNLNPVNRAPKAQSLPPTIKTLHPNSPVLEMNLSTLARALSPICRTIFDEPCHMVSEAGPHFEGPKWSPKYGL